MWEICPHYSLVSWLTGSGCFHRPYNRTQVQWSLLCPVLLHLWSLDAYLTAAVRLRYQSLISCWLLDINSSVLCGKESWKTSRICGIPCQGSSCSKGKIITTEFSPCMLIFTLFLPTQKNLVLIFSEARDCTVQNKCQSWPLFPVKVDSSFWPVWRWAIRILGSSSSFLPYSMSLGVLPLPSSTGHSLFKEFFVIAHKKRANTAPGATLEELTETPAEEGCREKIGPCQGICSPQGVGCTTSVARTSTSFSFSVFPCVQSVICNSLSHNCRAAPQSCGSDEGMSESLWSLLTWAKWSNQQPVTPECAGGSTPQKKYLHHSRREGLS